MRIAEKFRELKAKNEKALIAYICAGDPSADATREYVHTLVKGGVDMVELGLPFSDPVADGPTIQAASDRSLEAGMNPDTYFELAASIKEQVPLICMTYYNLIFRRGVEKFVKDCAASGITGIIVPDLPIEETDDILKACKAHCVDMIFMVTPLTDKERMQKIFTKGSGFLYIVSRLGVTGTRADVAKSTKEVLDKVNTALPRAVGFGISNGKQATEVIAAGADAIIVGSAFVNIIASQDNVEGRLEELARELKAGCIGQ
ncbi:tryptophan synthase subunit alpha [Methanomethylovorans sp.]|uniref:tryptophan synthase subunit alpha n=1 Tax=Methanomethylovorans sp. TaxID=2758717 RepID=UPI000AF62D67|nr:tryptophan synthase subunit alpha [Methanomethylovorans sp.]